MTIPTPAGFSHGFPFDPTGGLDLDGLLAITPPEPPDGFEAFWRARHARALAIDPAPLLGPPIAADEGRIVLHDLAYRSTDAVTIRGWYARPAEGPIRRGLVVGHGYGGRDGPDLDMVFPETAVIFPCLRGLSRSTRAEIPADPQGHVLHGIASRETYVLGGCVDDLWLAVSALSVLEPQVAGRIGWSGISFGGGIGALGVPWDDRIGRAELRLPTFGHHALRLRLPMIGSGAAVRAREAAVGGVMATLVWYDAATAARFLRVPVLYCCALFDPAVPPPGQFAVHNATPGDKTLVIFPGGHFDYDGAADDDRRRLALSTAFFTER